MRRTQIRARPNLDDGPSPWLVAFRERVDGYIADAARAEGEEAAERGVTVDELPALWKTDAAIEAARQTRTRTQIEGEIREQFPGDLEDMTLDSFNPQSDSQSAALVGAREWVADYTAAVVGMGKRPSQGMILFGRNGRGKTHIAAGVLKAITSPLVTIRFVNVPLFLDEMRQSFADGPGSRAGVMLARCLDVDVLVLDDIGQERPTEWVIDTLGQIIFHRHTKALPIIATTNMTIQELTRRADGQDNAAGVNLGAMYSRLRERFADHAYYFDGEDFRVTTRGR